MYTLKKSLGQHFLKDENICRQIITALEKNKFANLLEVGPGAGALTKYLLLLDKINLRCVEVDEEKVMYLLQTYPGLQKKMIHQSILDMNPPFEGACFAVIGNFPYNISSQIIFKILEWKDQASCMIGMFQKEVAQRIVAAPGNKVYGVISVLVQAFFDAKYLFEVDPQCFQPPPKVKSAVIQLTIKNSSVIFKSEKLFFLLVKTAFHQRRKMLRNAVKGFFEPSFLQDPLFSQRAEQLSVQDFANLTFKMNT
jgi:16S rRNA (adenine1518-N6/adenine1519-N6)-dimethyltransferase